MNEFLRFGRLVLAILVLSAIVAVPAGAMVPEDIYDIGTVTPVDLSPDGRYLLFSLGVYDRDAGGQQTSLHRRDLETDQDLLIFTPQDASYGAVWSPDGRSIAYLREGDDGTEIWRMAADGSDRRRVSRDAGPFGALTWSPDGAFLAWIAPAAVGPYEGVADACIVADDIGYRHLGDGYREGRLGQVFVMDVAVGTSQRLLTAELDVRALAWSPDSRHLAVSAKARADLGRTLNTDLWVIGLDGRAPSRLTDQPGPDDQPLWRSDGRLAWLRRDNPLWETAPAVIAVTKKPVRPGDPEGRPLIGDDEIKVHGRTWDNFFWCYAWSDDDIYILGTNRGCIDLVRLDGDAHEILTDTQHDFWSIEIAGDRAILSGADQTLPGGIFVVDLNDGDRPRAPRLLIDPNQTWRRRVGLVEPEPFSVDVDGRTIAGWFFKPAFLEPGEKIPTVLSIHGGPQWMYGGYFLPEFHILPSFGYGVIAANPTGSTGYGYDFQQGCRGDWLGRPADEVLACVDLAVAQGWADPDRLAVMGGSYGGHLAAALTTLTDRFRAAACDRMFPETIAFWGTTDEKWFAEWEFMGRPWEPEAREVYLRCSPFDEVDRVTTPTLISQGELDYRCRMAGGEMWFSALQSLGVPSRFLRFQQEGHGIGRPANQVFYQNQLLNWFDTYVLEKTDDHGD